jgi:hypothetical protein
MVVLPRKDHQPVRGKGMTAQSDSRQKYLYCVIRSGEERSFDAEAIGDSGAGVHTVLFQDLAVVVSDSAEEKYDHTRANLMAHEKVIEGVMKEGFTVLPVRFGRLTLATSKNPVEAIQRQVLKRRGEEFHALLAEMDDKAELGLKALWRDEKTIFEEIVAENLGIQRLRDSLQGRSAAATHYQRLRLGEGVKAALDRKREHEREGLRAALRPLTWKYQENKIVLDRMVCNDAFLVERRREEEFDQLVGQLDQELGHRLVFKYSGPNPPFNFVELEVTWDEEEAG